MSNKEKGKALLEQPVSAGTEAALSAPRYTPGKYTPSDKVTGAAEALEKHNVQSPGQYKSKWQDKIDGTVDKILNREEFSYDVNGDALYKQYADQYARNGKTAMEDTIARASAMTGGYGNSYAQTAGQAAYAGEMQKLNDVIPELYQLALDKYTREGDTLRDNYAMLTDADATDYGRHRDEVSDWRDERDYLADRADTLYDRDYGEWADGESLRAESAGQLNDDYWKGVSIEREDEQIQYDRSNDAYETLKERILSTGYNPTDAELAAADMTRGEADAYGEQYSLGMQDMYNSVYGTGGDDGGDEPEYYPYGEYTQKEYINALMKYQDEDFGTNRAISAGGFAVSIGTPEALYLCENMTGGVSAYYEAYNGIIPEHEWQAAKEIGAHGDVFDEHETYESYYEYMTD